MTAAPQHSKSQVRTYRAGSLREALSIVRAELGPDAAITRTREVPAGGLLNRLFGKTQIEVTVSNDAAQAKKKKPAQAAAAKSLAGTVEHIPQRTVVDEAGLDLSRLDHAFHRNALTNQEEANESGDYPQALPRRFTISEPYDAQPQARRSLEALHGAACCATLAAQPLVTPWPEAGFALYAALLEADVAPQFARELIANLFQSSPPRHHQNPAQLAVLLRERLAAELPASGPIRTFPGKRKVAALVGPTGVGKTTTIAKLAANARLREGRRVGLLTMDTYRIAAVEQLRTYAEIIDLPLAVVTTPQEIREALQRMDDLELVLIDTAGRSPHDDARVHELREMLAAARPDEVHLVLSGTSSGRALAQTAERFAAINFSHVLLTKLDEALTCGTILDLLRVAQRPLSYVTNGQNVPADIAVAESAAFAERILPREADDFKSVQHAAVRSGAESRRRAS